MSKMRMHTTISLLAVGLSTALVFPDANAAASHPKLREGGTLTVALREAPDVLDPTTSQTYVGRDVMVNMCEKLYDINAHLSLLPQLATKMPTISDHGKVYLIHLRKGVKFNDGTPFNAEAVKTTLERNMHDPRSSRASALKAIKSVTVVNPTTIKLTLSHPYAPLISILAGRAGMIESPTKLKKLGNNFGQHPVCVGPFSFVSRPSSDRIILRKSKYYYDRKAVHLKRVIFEAVTQPSVRAQNLQAGAIQVAGSIAPPNVAALQQDPKTRVISEPSLAYEGITINVSNGNGSGHPPKQMNTPLAQHPKLREAFALALNRKVLNQVVFDGQYAPACTPIPKVSPYYPSHFVCPAYNPAKAKKLVAESGVKTPIKVTLMMEASNQLMSKLGQVIQSMEQQAGFNVVLKPTEFTTSLAQARAGTYDAFLIGWSGRVDPDQNLAPFWQSGSMLNYSGAHYAGINKLIHEERAATKIGSRRKIFTQLVHKMLSHNNIIYLYHPKFLLGVRKDVVGVGYYPDQLIRLKNAAYLAK